jgi:hypothetical protein
LSDLCTSWCVHVVVTLCIAEHIEAGETDIHDIADRAHCVADMLQQVMRHFVGKGVFREPESGRFELAPAARPMLDPSFRLGVDLDGVGGLISHAWGTLLTAVRTGSPAHKDYFGLPFWEDLEARPQIAAEFDALIGVQGHGVPDPSVLGDDDWQDVKKVVDVGGGTGSLVAEILRAHPIRSPPCSSIFRERSTAPR